MQTNGGDLHLPVLVLLRLQVALFSPFFKFPRSLADFTIRQPFQAFFIYFFWNNQRL